MRRKGPEPNWGERTEEETTSAYRLAVKIAKAAKNAQGYFDYLAAMENFMNDQRVRGAEQDYSAESRKGDWTPMMADLHRMNMEMQKKIREDMKKGGPVLDLYEAFCQSLLLEAPWDFEQYMLYCEIDRPPEEKFYQPRMKTLRPIVQAMQALEDNELDEVFLSQPPRTGKALSNDTPVLTTKGWKNHGDLVVGDELFCPDGTTTKVIAVHPKCQMTHTVTFTDGSSIDCHFRHEWLVHDRRFPFKEYRLLETQEMIGKVDNSHLCDVGKRGHRYTFQLLAKEPLQGKRHGLPVKPYTFGVWLGDGANRNPRITGDFRDTDILVSVNRDGYTTKNTFIHKTTGVVSTDFEGLRVDLQKMGFCHSRRTVPKYIPDVYLTASIDQRLELLAGLLDTDGCLRRSEHRYDFTTADEKLKDSFVSLVATFGWRVCAREIEPSTSSSGIVGKHKYWVISFNPTMYIPCRLSRKQLRKFSKPRRVAIKSIEPIAEPKEGNCITVEKDGMYLAGERLVPTHNTTLMDFFMTWEIGKHPDGSCLYSSMSDTVTKQFYLGLLEILRDPYTYHWGKVFPNSPVVKVNAADQTVNCLRKTRYPSVTCRSIEGTLNGACDCDNILVADDLCKGLEQAINKDVMAKLWARTQTDLLSRAKQGSKKLWIGTRWSLIDPIGCRVEMLKNEPKLSHIRWKEIILPALNEHDESNFNWKYGIGFDTQTFQGIRAGYERNNDMASWNAVYQQQPIEREGSLFASGDMRFYNGVLPDKEPARIFMAVDPAFGGSDFTAAPVCYQYDNDVYVVDVVYTDGDKRESIPALAKAVQKWKVGTMQIEANKMTEGYADELQAYMRQNNIFCTVMTKPAPNNVSKEQRIFDRAPEIRESFLFLENGQRSKTYQQFMDNVFSFTIMKRNKHDDAPDSLAMAASMVFRYQNNFVHTFRRVF